jgi:hypothetical protein
MTARLPADVGTTVIVMFQAPRQLFHRSSSTTATPTSGSNSRGKAGDAQVHADRHPAMRGLNVSPVHGRHCICGRCDKPDHAA